MTGEWEICKTTLLMRRSADQLRDDAKKIWWAGVQAVQPERLIPDSMTVDDGALWIADHVIALEQFDSLTIVGAGKASGAMAVAVERVLGTKLLTEKQVQGWVNVPADCIEPTQTIHLHAARPAGVNEPTAEGVEGTRQILRLVERLGPRDLCLFLISGGGSALLPMPIEGVTLADKIAVTRQLAERGADITELNAVRREISVVKGGGLAQRCHAGQIVTLTLSDVMGDDLEVIASGPTVPREPTPELALDVLSEWGLLKSDVGRTIEEVLRNPRHAIQNSHPVRSLLNVVIGNNSTAVDSAGILAERLGYSHAMISGNPEENSADATGRHLAETAKSMRENEGPDCLISGGESTVELAPESNRGKGGRNQQVALAALHELDDWRSLALVSAGTDGEDGPTDAAGAVIDEEIAKTAHCTGLNIADFLKRNDAYQLFQQCGGLFKTGPTGTNVCDLRVVCVGK